MPAANCSSVISNANPVINVIAFAAVLNRNIANESNGLLLSAAVVTNPETNAPSTANMTTTQKLHSDSMKTAYFLPRRNQPDKEGAPSD